MSDFGNLVPSPGRYPALQGTAAGGAKNRRFNVVHLADEASPLLVAPPPWCRVARHSVHTLCGRRLAAVFDPMDSVLAALALRNANDPALARVRHRLARNVLCANCYRALRRTDAELADLLKARMEATAALEARKARTVHRQQARRKKMDFPENVVREAYANAGGRCLLCASQILWNRRGKGREAPAWDAHHIEGESPALDNLAILCAACHRRVTAESATGTRARAWWRALTQAGNGCLALLGLEEARWQVQHARAVWYGHILPHPGSQPDRFGSADEFLLAAEERLREAHLQRAAVWRNQIRQALAKLKRRYADGPS